MHDMCCVNMCEVFLFITFLGEVCLMAYLWRLCRSPVNIIGGHASTR